MGEDCIRIERLTNGFEVEIKDPAIEKENNKPSSGKGPSVWKSPWKSYAFSTEAEVIDFIKKNLSKTAVGDEYGSAFDVAAAEEEGD